MYSYMISERYVRTWTATQAIRELISNALDAAPLERITMRWEDGQGVIRNTGVVMEKRYLLLGESEKDAGQIGQFGEGLKLAALVLCRNGRKVQVHAGPCIYDFSLVESAEFGIRTLGVEVSEGPPLEGTQVAFGCSEAEFEQARQMFRVYNGRQPLETIGQQAILEGQGEVYVLGVKVSQVEKALFSYDLADKALVNRDRTVVDQANLRSAVANLLGDLREFSLIKRLLKEANEEPEAYERNLFFYPCHASYWKEAIEDLWGEQVCLAAKDAEANARAQYLDYVVIDCGPGLNNVLRNYCRVKTALDVAPPSVRALDRNALTVEERQALDKVLRYVRRVYRRDVLEDEGLTVSVTEELPAGHYAQVEGRQIFLSRRYLEDIPRATAAVLHEVTHVTSAASDCTAVFENGLTRLLEIMVANVMMRSR